MSSVFPNLSRIPAQVTKTLKSRAGKNITASNLLCWIRVASAAASLGEGEQSSGGLVLESFQNKKKPGNSEDPEKQWSSDTFSARYGSGTNKSGRVGTDFQGNSIYAPGETRLHRPSPVIESMSVQNGQEGLSRKCTFAIKCFTLSQTETITKYFLEPGFNVLVEFGWNTPEGRAKKEAVLSACNIARHNNFAYVNGKRKGSDGHYDCFLGVITGGGIKSGDGESYIVDVELTTLGEMPTYLQQHRGDNNSTNDTQNKGDKLFDITNIEAEIEAGNIGRGLFKQMFNRLPASKQTNNVKNLITTKDFLGVPFSSAHNFINMDNELREKLVERYQDVSVLTGDEKDTDGNRLDAKIPEGAPLFSDQSFIRLELAFKILNTCRYNLTQETKKCQMVEKGFSSEIDINSTICRAFPNMFSTDPSILIIPNTESPEFNLLEALSSTKAVTDYLGMEDGRFTGKIQNLNFAEVYPDAMGEQDPKHYAFPALTKLSEDKYFETLDERNIDSDILTKDSDKGYWGYLRNLYINFDFFCEVISRSNVVTKDIYLDLLNGISSAVNSHWYFEIVDLCDPTTKEGAHRLTIRDLSFIGQAKPSLLSVIEKECSFYSKGIQTPFLSSDLIIDIPAAMKNHVIGKRISEDTELIQEGAEAAPEMGKLFSKIPDPVIKILNDLKPIDPADATYTEDEIPQNAVDKAIDKAGNWLSNAGSWVSSAASTAWNKASEAATGVYDAVAGTEENEIRSKNYELFIGKAAVFPFLNNREEIPEATDGWLSPFRAVSEGVTTIQNIAFVGAWKSFSALKTLEKGCPPDGGVKEEANPILMPIEFNFTIHGMSGIRVGDLFKIKDIPSQYRSGVFQVVETSHSIDGNQWITTVKGKFRNTNSNDGNATLEG